MKSLRVLITNFALRERTGTEVYAFDLARGLLAQGHAPVLYSPRPGALAEKIRRETVPVVDDLDRLSAPPDIIHGQHADETVTALLRFPSAPAVYVCHDWYFANDAPPRFPRVLRYVAVDSACRDKLVYEHGVPEERVSVLTQFVDLEKFRPRAPLPARPRRALVLCNQTKENAHLEAARAACRRAGITLDAYGLGVGRPCERPEVLLADYDVVFAKARTALEALAVGCWVVVYWWRRLGPPVTLSNFEQLRLDNFGMRAMTAELTPEEFGRAVAEALARYDPAEAARVSGRVRAEAGLDRLVPEFVSVYETAIAEHAAAGPRDEEAEARASASYLRALTLSKGRQYDTLYDSATFRVRERLLRVPLLSRVARAAANALGGARDGAAKSKGPKGSKT
ncbi:MAG: glycosyltransferase [Acidobacteria bacterium]|nr:glycosyltransferase [Acidobacteriota bacterium]